jgi:MarR family transcriptional regulator, organic hydroperoxide resistance regulator
MSPPRRAKAPSQGGFLLAKAHQISGRIFSKLLKDAGGAAINPAQGRILFALWKVESMSITALAKETSLEPSTLTSMLDRLEAAGLVRRRPSAQDRRALEISCTAGGRAIQTHYATVSARMTEIFYGDMGADEIASFEKSLKQIVANLETAEGAK